MDKFLSRKPTFDDNKASTSAQTSIVPKIKSRKYSQEYLNFGFTITEVNGEEKPLCVICSKILAADSMKPNKLKKTFPKRFMKEERIDVFRVVERRTKEELLCVIKEWVLPGSTIVSDCWKAYKCLSDEGFKHLEVNHSVCFKDPDTGAHTNSIEGTWSAIKRFLRNHTSHAEGMFDHYLAEYLWRRSRDHSLSDETFEILKAVITLYPPLGKDQQ
ncbi:DDE_Tnp_IS1595 domain-containing protein [Trichonephila clavipes]|nr:DDE_Tnp_IS1595 domain-containing protein [Trichonephila clavipes]